MVSLDEKKHMLDYLRNDINRDLSGFITRTILQRPSNFYEYGVQDFQEQLKLKTLRVPEGKSPSKKLSPLQSTQSILQADHTKSTVIFDESESSANAVEGSMSMSVSSSEPELGTALAPFSNLSTLTETVSRSKAYNQSAVLFNSLEDAKLEIENLKSIISHLSLNIRG
jgi:hypothetical protein